MRKESGEFRLDRDAFRAGKAEDVTIQKDDYGKMTWQERLRVAHYLISAAYNLPVDNWPPMDKEYFRKKKR